MDLRLAALAPAARKCSRRFVIRDFSFTSDSFFKRKRRERASIARSRVTTNDYGVLSIHPVYCAAASPSWTTIWNPSPLGGTLPGFTAWMVLQQRV